MTVLAGLIRFDGQEVPGSWLVSMIERGTKPGYTESVRRHGSAVFLRLESNPRGTPETNQESNFVAQTGERFLLMDGRVANREELASHFPVPPQANDAALADAAFSHWGVDFGSRIMGEFAIVIWNARERRLLLARDAPGFRTLFYFSSETLFAFSTDLPVLLTLPRIPRKLREEAIADYLGGDGSDAAGRTFYEAVHVLPAGHTLSLDQQRSELRCFWPAQVRRPSVAVSNRDFAHDLRARISEAVEFNLQGGKRVAVHLSGGLDSSSIACLAARLLKKEGRRLLAFCSMLPKGYDGPESDEKSFVEAVAAQETNIDLFWIELPMERDPFCALDRWFDVLGQPFYSTVTHIEEALGEAARAHGVDVVLSGFGGDFFASCPGRNATREILRSGALRLAASQLYALYREQRTPLPRLLKEEVISPFLGPLIRAWRTAGPPKACVHPELARRIKNRRLRNPVDSSAIAASFSPTEAMRFVLAPGHLEQPVASMIQVFAREFDQQLRFPMLDRRIIEFMLEVPVEQLRQGGWPRSLMRRAMEGILPEKIRLRPDKGGAFDPGISSRVVACRRPLADWARISGQKSCWSYVDRERFLEALSAVERAPRARWQPGMFQVVLRGMIVARFIEWYERSERRACA